MVPACPTLKVLKFESFPRICIMFANSSHGSNFTIAPIIIAVKRFFSAIALIKSINSVTFTNDLSAIEDNPSLPTFKPRF